MFGRTATGAVDSGAAGVVKLTKIQLANPQEVGVKRCPERYTLCRDSEIECQLDSTIWPPLWAKQIVADRG